MTPLTHAAVGMAICQRVRSPRLGRFGWPLALALAFASHFLLDSIPHVDPLGPLRGLGSSLWLYLGLVGAGLTCYLYTRNRDAGLIWILLSAWLGITGLAGTMVRSLAALAFLGLLAYRTRRADAVAYLLAGMLAVSGDLVPARFDAFAKFHNAMHYRMDWGVSFFLQYQSPPLPSGILARLQNPYFQLGYGLEVLVEAAFFLTAFSILSRLALVPKAVSEHSVPATEREETGVPV